MNPAIVETQGLTKRYRKLVAVDDMNLRVKEGEIYGFLGPNGSGKTTTILMLLGLTEPSAGQARVGGFDPVREPLKVKRLVGYLPENVGFYTDLTARQNLRYTCSLNGVPPREAESRIDPLLERVGLSGNGDRPVGQFSRGMRQRLGIADVLIKQPKVAFLDDPTIGLDPEGIRTLLEMVVDLSREHGITVFLSSHMLQQVQRICDRIGIMFQGRMVAEGAMDELSKSDEAAGIRIEVEVDRVTDALVADLERLEGVREAAVADDLVTLESDLDVRGMVAATVLGQGCQLLSLRAVDRSLEDIYMRYFRQAETAGQPT